MRFIDGSPVDDRYLEQLQEINETHFSAVAEMNSAQLDEFERSVEAYRWAVRHRHARRAQATLQGK